MNNKLVLFLLLIFLILLLLFYYLQIQSNIIILLGVIIILLLNDLITKKEHFTTHNELDSLLSQVDNTLTNLSRLRSSVEERQAVREIPFLKVESSCAPNISSEVQDLSPNPLARDSLEAINVPNLDEDGVPLSIESSELLSGISD